MPYSPHRKRFPKYSPGGKGGVGYSQVGGPSTLPEGLVSWWSFDETSGTRTDAVGSNDWTDFNTVGFTTGKIGNAANMLKVNAERLDLTNDFWSGGDFTWSGWINKDADETKVCIRCATTNGGSGFAFRVFFNSSNDRFQSEVYDSVAGSSIRQSGVNLSTFPQWHFVAVGYSTADKKVRINVDDEGWLVSPTALTNGVKPATFNNIALDSSTGYTNVISDLYGVWSRLLTAKELEELYNGGAGVDYPF